MDILLELDSFDATFEALSTIYGTQESDIETFKAFMYEGYLMESGADSDIVMEGALDIFKTIADGIKKFIERVKEFFKKILTYLNAGTEDLDKLAAKVKEHIKDKDVDFTIDGYKFTVVDKKGPDTSEFQKIVAEYNEDMANLKELKDAEVKNRLTDWLSESKLDKLRGTVLGTGNSIDESDYLDTIRKYYRNDEESTSEIKVDKNYVNGIIDGSKKLEEVKKSAIKDRDTLVTLLSKTEAFFDKSLPMIYKGNDLQANVAKISTTDNKFSKENNYQSIGDAQSKILTTYAAIKSRQVNKIAGMINLVASERVNALKDQIKQERTVLKRCLFGNTSDSKVEEAMQIFPEIGYGGRGFDTYAMESSVLNHKYYDQITQMALVTEAKFLTESVLSGRVQQITEADMDKTAGKIKQALAEIIESVVAAFRKKAIGETAKYKPWLDEIRDGLVEKAKAKKEFKMASFSKANYATMANSIMGAIRKAYSNKNYEDYSFAKDVVNGLDSLEKINDDSSRAVMLNYFRTGKADVKLDTVTLSGSALANEVPNMVKYLEQYGNTVTKPAENISNTFKTQSERFSVTESAMGSSYLDLIGRPICESDVVLCPDYEQVFGPVAVSELVVREGMDFYQFWVGGSESVTVPLKKHPVTEAGETNIGNANGGNTEANKSNANNQNASGNEGAKEAKDITSATQATSVDDPNAKQPEGEQKTNNQAVTYKKNADRFFKNAITTYIKAREEQFLAYVNALSEIDGSRPKFDDKGKYIPKADKQKNDQEAVQAQSK